jgi:hypothetical protein
MKVAKENARLLAAQSPPLAVGTSRRSTDQSMASDSSSTTTPLHASSSVHNTPSTTNLSGASRPEALAHSGLNETMTTVAEVKEDEISSNDKEKAKRLSVNLGSDQDDTQKHPVEKQDSGLGRKEHHEGTDDSSYKDTTGKLCCLASDLSQKNPLQKKKKKKKRLNQVLNKTPVLSLDFLCK